jgi:hypothetical protein
MTTTPIRPAARIARRTGANAWDAQAAILMSLEAPRAAHASAMNGARLCRMEGASFASAARHFLEHAAAIRAGTAWGVSTPRPIP